MRSIVFSLLTRLATVNWILLGVIAFSSVVSAQADSATVLGTIQDANGGAVPNVTVRLKNIATGIVTTLQTDVDGKYEFFNVKIGDYVMSAESNGFKTAVAEKFSVAVSARQRVDLTLEVGETAEVVTVSGAAQILETDASARGQIVDRRQVVNLPLNGRNYASLSLLAPGVRESNLSQNPPGSRREAAFNVNGLRSTVNNFLLDGVDNNGYGTSNQGFSSQVVQVSPDAVAEFKIVTGTYSAEFGRSGGAVVSASYRSGTNEFHGAAWNFLRNTALNAVGYFKPRDNVKPRLNRNQFGFVFGGPIQKDRTFFFVDYEGQRQLINELTFSTVPTLAQRRGVLSVPVRTPYAFTDADGNFIPAGTTFAPGTRIPQTAFARRVLNELPPPNGPGAANNFSNLVLNKDFNDKFNIRIDRKFRDDVTAFVRLSHRKVNGFEAPNIPGPSGGNQNGIVNILNQQLVAGATVVLPRASALDVRLGISRVEAGKKPPLIGGPSMRELYGITGLPEDPAIVGGLTTQTINGFSELGRQATNPQFQNPFSVNPRASYGILLGNHSLKVGAELLAVNVDVQDTNPLLGRDTYAGQFSRPAGAAANTQYNLADFFFGARSQYDFANARVFNVRRRLYSGFVQDDFKAAQRLTLNLGVRYEYSTPFVERDNLLSNYDPTTNSVIRAGGGTIQGRSLVNPDRNNFAPRIGLAYQPFNKTVIRAGYGIGYVYFNRLGSADLLATNFPQITRSSTPQGVFTAQGTPRPICTGDAFSSDCFRPTQAGYPTGLPNGVTLFIPKSVRDGYIQNWQLSVQRQLTQNTLLDVAYVGNHAVKLALLADLNQARPLRADETLATSPVSTRRPIPGFASISAALPAGYSNYHAMQVKLEHRGTRGLYLLNSFTWSKAIDNVGQVLEEPNGNTGTPQNLFNLDADRGLSPYDQRVNNTTSVVYDLPFGRGRQFGRDLSPILNALVGGWSVNVINTMTTGQPITVRNGRPSNVTDNLPSFLGGVALRPNLTGQPLLTSESQRNNPSSVPGVTTTRYLNPSAFSLPDSATTSNPFGDAGRNLVRSHAFFQADLGVQKNFPFRFINEEARLEFRAEFFNVLNKTNFRAANPDANSPGFGTITGAFAPRQIQVALKLVF